MNGDEVIIKIYFKTGDGSYVEQGSFPATRAKAYQVNDFLMGRMQTLTPEVSTDVAQAVILSEPATKSQEFHIPSSGKIKDFIRSRQNYEFMIDDVVREFAGRDVSKDEGIEAGRFIGSIRTKVGRIRDEIKKEEAGTWTEDYQGRYKIFKFIKSTDTQDNGNLETIPVFQKNLGSQESE